MGVMIYGTIVYGLFLGTFLYAVGFVENFGVPKTIDSGAIGPVSTAVLVNLLLLGLFGVQHSVMARPAFKRRITRYIPAAAERSTFVLATCVVFALLFWQWRPIDGYLWHVAHPGGRALLYALSLGGFGIVLYATFLINHFDLFGLRQVVLHWRAIKYTHTPFQTPWVYRLVRNPLMTGFMIAFWATPDMTWGRLLFALTTTAYIFVGVWFEERDLARHLGAEYIEYKRRTPAFIPGLSRNRSADTDQPGYAPQSPA